MLEVNIPEIDVYIVPSFCFISIDTLCCWLLDLNSVDVLKSELDLFSVPGTQTSIESCRVEQCHPVTSIDGGPIAFQFKGEIS